MTTLGSQPLSETLEDNRRNGHLMKGPRSEPIHCTNCIWESCLISDPEPQILEGLPKMIPKISFRRTERSDGHLDITGDKVERLQGSSDTGEKPRAQNVIA